MTLKQDRQLKEKLESIESDIYNLELEKSQVKDRYIGVIEKLID